MSFHAKREAFRGNHHDTSEEEAKIRELMLAHLHEEDLTKAAWKRLKDIELLIKVIRTVKNCGRKEKSK